MTLTNETTRDQPGAGVSPPPRSRWPRTALQWAVRLLGLGLFVWLLIKVGPAKIIATLTTADARAWIPACLLAVLFIVLKAQRWDRLVMGLELPRLGLLDASRLYAIGLWAGQATPGQAGDFLKAWYLRARGADLGLALLSSFLDRLFDLGALFALAAVATGLLLGAGQGLVVLILLGLFVVVVIAAVMSERWRRPLGALLGRLLPGRWRDRLLEIPTVQRLSEARLRPATAWPAVGWTAVSWVVSVGRIWLCFIALSINLPTPDLLAIILLQGVAGLISIGGIGTRDAFLIAALGRYGYEATTALVLSFLILLVNVSNLIPGLLIWLREPVPLSGTPEAAPATAGPQDGA